MVGRLLSFWDGLLSGAMLNFEGVADPSSPSRVRIQSIVDFEAADCVKAMHLVTVKKWDVFVFC